MRPAMYIGTAALVVVLELLSAAAERKERRETQVRLDHVSAWFLGDCYKLYSHSECNKMWEVVQE